jgi:hypothetical protein
MNSPDLSRTEILLLEALAEEGTRWHHVDDLAATIELPERIVRSGLASLRRREFATPRAQLGPGARQWSITTIGAAIRPLEQAA